MDPISLTCPKCAASWKLIKAGNGPVVCPKCNSPIGETAAAEPVVRLVGTSLSEPAPPPTTEPPAPAISPLLGLSPPPRTDTSDADDPGLRQDYDDRMMAPPVAQRRRMHPLLVVFLVLLTLFVLLPLALLALFFAVCALGAR
jgi:hypothetical protein